MRRIIGGGLFLVAGAVAGLASAVSAIEIYGAGSTEAGSVWQSWDVSAVDDAHPYSLAHFLMAGRFPPATGQVREYSTRYATDGSSLSANCEYVLTAKSAPVEWWSIAAYASGLAVGSANATITSDSAIAEHDGSMKLTVSRFPASGNWLRPPVAGGFTLLYTVAVPSPSQSKGRFPVFTIERGKC